MSRASLLRWSGLAVIVAAGVSLITKGPLGDAVLPFLRTELGESASLLYVAGHIFMLFGFMGIYAHQHEKSGVLGFAGFVVAVVGINFLGVLGEVAGMESYVLGGSILALGVLLLAGGLWIANEFPRWVPGLWVLSVVVGIPGFAIESLMELSIMIAAVVFAVGFGGAGYVLWSKMSEPAVGTDTPT